MDTNNSTLKGWHRILILIIPYFIIVGIFQFIGMIIAGVDYTTIDSPKTSEQYLIVSIFDLIGTFVLLWGFIKWVDKEKFITLGFQIKNRLNNIALGILIGLLIMAVGYLALMVLEEIEYHTIVYSIKEILISVLIFSIVSIVEEVLFRGYVLRNLMLSFNKYIALIVSSLLFALMHGFNPNMDWFSYLDLFLAGMLLGVSYIYTKNLWFPIALHFSWNFFQTLFGFNVSGQDFYSLIEFQITEKNILNGGDFGFEGSVLSIIAQLFVIALVLFHYNKKSKQTQH
ncbi:MAG: CPBP family intramembrane metalloprotease [Flavobacteriaceae bacterium]|nr:CPBP family intramembrane metalloprotease [Flavobacteriaceae bacterium]